jgi:predicted membrane protein
MEEIEAWFIDLTNMQVLGLGILVFLSPFVFILLWAAIRVIVGDFIASTVSIFSFIFLYVYFLRLCNVRTAYVLSQAVRKKEQIRKNYESAKNKLRQQPSNNQLREKALQDGREYYKSLRNGVLSIYDEQAITNDLAAVAPVSQTNNIVQPNIDKADDNSQSDIVVKLEKLNLLKDKGMITESEFEAKRKDLIDKM